MMRCSRCSHPTTEERRIFGDAKIIVCDECATDDDPEFVVVHERAEGGSKLP